LADIHLALRPGTDAWLLAAIAGVLVQEDLVARRWLAEHAVGLDAVVAALAKVPVARYAAVAGIAEADGRRAARRPPAARSVAVFEALGTQMNLHSTLNSYLDNLIWLLTGNFGKPGANNPPLPFVSLGGSEYSARGGPAKTSPVAGAPIIAGLVPCNVIADEILSDHPSRYRAMIVESANPAYTHPDRTHIRAGVRELERLVVLDVACPEAPPVAAS